MKIFIAGATGVLGIRLTKLLAARGDTVIGLTRSPDKRKMLEQLGASAVVGDALDPQAIGRAISEAEPNVVVHQLTALSELSSIRNFEKAFAQNARLRSEGTDILLSASRAAGVEVFVAQSYAGFLFAPSGTRVMAEEDALDPEPPSYMARALSADRHLEEAVTGAEWLRGTVLRYGVFYGPGTTISRQPPGVQSEMIRKRQFPIIGHGRGLTSFVHIDDAARATVAAIDHGQRGIYHVVDDEPAPYAVWLPFLASTLGGRPPFRIPIWLGRMAAGPAAALMMTQSRGASNRKARRELDWAPHFTSWREGFVHGLG